MRIVDGTKGGGRPRDRAQGGPLPRYPDFQCTCYREHSGWNGGAPRLRPGPLRGSGGRSLPGVAAGVRHGKAHHAFLAERLGLSVAQAKAWDLANRKTIAEELGHGRIGITNAYLG